MDSTLIELSLELKVPYGVVCDMPYEHILKYQAHFKEFPIGWRDDDRAATVALAVMKSSMGGDKIKTTKADLFHSLKVLEEGQRNRKRRQEAEAYGEDPDKPGNNLAAFFTSVIGNRLSNQQGLDKIA